MAKDVSNGGSGDRPPGFPVVQVAAESILGYGLADLNATRIGTDDDREDLLVAVEKTIKRYEPRFKSVTVTGTSRSSLDRNLRFHIRAEVYADPVPEEIHFDTLVEPIARTVEVKTER